MQCACDDPPDSTAEPLSYSAADHLINRLYANNRNRIINSGNVWGREAPDTRMVMFLKHVRWVVLLACYVVVAKSCSLFHVKLPMNSLFRPHPLAEMSIGMIEEEGYYLARS